MANIKSSLKDIRRIKKRTERNRQVRSKLKTLRKRVLETAEGGDAEAVKAAAVRYISELDKAAKRSQVHPNRASRQKSVFTRFIFGQATVAEVKAASAEPTPAEEAEEAAEKSE